MPIYRPTSAPARGRVRIFDTTLRDGEQAPGASLEAHEKLEVALALARLRVDVIEAGFPAASDGEFAAVRDIAAKVSGPSVAALARCRDGDPQRAIEAISGAKSPHLHVFIATSDIHLDSKLRMSRDEAIASAVRWVAYGRKALGPEAEVEFSAEDATRTDPEFLMRMFEAVLEAGATTLNIPDTVGYATPGDFGPLVASVVGRFGDDAVISVHCHNDLGLATANTLAAIAAGARQAEVCVNGLGERAGNAALEEVVMALAVRPGSYPSACGVDATAINATSALVSRLTGFAVQPNKAIVGANAFAHESGIHQDGVLKNPLTYEIMTPASVGLASSTLSIGKLSGRRGLAARLSQLGYQLDGPALDAAYARAMARADARKPLADADLAAIAADAGHSAATPPMELRYWRVVDSSEDPKLPASALVQIDLAGDPVHYHGSAKAEGAVEALFGAVDKALSEPAAFWTPVLLSYEVRSVTPGEGSLASATVRVRRSDTPGGNPGVAGHGLSADVLEASLLAYLDALGRLAQ